MKDKAASFGFLIVYISYIVLWVCAIACIILILSSCVANPATLPTTKSLTDMADMSFSVDGMKYSGTAVLQRRSNYVFKFDLPKDTERVWISTCHRRLPFYGPFQSQFEYKYIPQMYLENWTLCFLKAEAITKSGQISFAVADFTSNESMKANVYCNGNAPQDFVGASFCQAAAGYRQMLRFDEKVDIETDENCSPIVCDGQYCYYKMSPGYCAYSIFGLTSKTRHRHSTRGFQSEEK